MHVVSAYHAFLRTAAVVFAMLVLFDGGFVVPITKELSDNALSYLANSATSVTAGVPETELNKVSGELSAWERDLQAREREIAARDFGSNPDYSTYILSSILFLLTVLIIVNYVLDWMRVRKTNLYAR